MTQLLFVDGEALAYTIIFVLAVLTRFWDLGARVMSHDESLHTRYSWNLYRGEGYSHTPLMHGPLLFHAVALSYLLFGDNDFTARIYPAVLGVGVVLIPLLMRRWLGRIGALATSVFFLISPLILYYSRYIRHDIPAILAALVMAVAIWRYIEDRQFKYLIVLSVAQLVLFASKEVSFIYIAIFGSFLTAYFVVRLLRAPWERETWRRVFSVALVAFVVIAVAFAGVMVNERIGAGGTGAGGAEAGTVEPVDPSTAAAGAEAPVTALSLPVLALSALLGITLLTMITAVLLGQWHNLRRFPELDVAVAMGTLILPALSPFLIHYAGFDPMDTSEQGVARSLAFVLPVFIASAVIGLGYFMKPPAPRRVVVAAPPGEGDGSQGEVRTTVVEPDVVDWLEAFLGSRWWAIGGPYWLLFLFFFTTMFTNGAGIGTGIVGSLGYWLEQQGVKRGGQPWYYYLLILVPLYEFLPLLLSGAAGVLGLTRWLGDASRGRIEEGSETTVAAADRRPPRKPLDLSAPIHFPVLPFIGYWAVINLFAYTLAGEKMPWLTTHLTTPMILLAGWTTGRLIESIRWRRLWRDNRWVLLLMIPVLIVSLLRVIAPACQLWPANPLCNTIIPLRFQQDVLAGRTVEALSATGVWIAAIIVTLGVIAGMLHHARHVGVGQFTRLLALLGVGWLAFITARSAWGAAYIRYDEATEFLVYAHASGAVGEVMDQIEEISLKTTDGLGLRVAYDDRVSWPMSWYLRDYYNAVYYGSEPSRGLIGDAPVILAGSSNWPKIEALIGDRYYQFEYIRMWWPMQDYFGYDKPAQLLDLFGGILHDGELQRGLWEIFYNRDYDAYADAVAKYRDGSRPTFELSQWPVPDRMRVYIRKDVFAQVWDYGAGAADIAETVDPYVEGFRAITPDAVFGQGTLNRPHGLTVGPDGRIYVADSGNHRIAIFDAEGNLVDSLGTFGQAPQPDAFNEPWDVAVGPEGGVFVADTWNHRILAYSASGEYLRNWGVDQAAENNLYAFWGPRGIAVSQQGEVFLTDTGNKRILVFSREGAFLRQIGSGGLLEGQLDEPSGLAFGPDGLLYVADTWNQRIQVFSPDGGYVREWPVDAWFAESNERPYLAVDAEGRVYVTDPDGSRVIVFNGMGDYIYSFGEVTTMGIAGGIAAAPDGSIYVADTEAGTILRYDSPGSGQ